MDRLYADLARMTGIEAPPIKLPLPAALALAQASRRVPGLHLPTEPEIRATSLRWAVSSKKAKRELKWETSPHEDCLEATVGYYRERDRALARAGTRQP